MESFREVLEAAAWELNVENRRTRGEKRIWKRNGRGYENFYRNIRFNVSPIHLKFETMLNKATIICLRTTMEGGSRDTKQRSIATRKAARERTKRDNANRKVASTIEHLLICNFLAFFLSCFPRRHLRDRCPRSLVHRVPPTMRRNENFSVNFFISTTLKSVI